MRFVLIKAIIILPGTVLVFVPALILWLSAGSSMAMAPAGVAQARFWIGLVVAVVGFVLAVWSARLFLTIGEGTPAPWEPPSKLVVVGPYRYVRNPMIRGVIRMLAAEALLLGSWPIAGWMLVFFLLKTIYLVRVEEPALEQRFREDYRLYKSNVRRWIPRMTPWDLP